MSGKTHGMKAPAGLPMAKLPLNSRPRKITPRNNHDGRKIALKDRI
jgi:hypothetical protein